MGAKLTQGAIRAAEIATGGKYGSNERYATEYGGKTVEGIAAIIDDQTAAPELLEALAESERALRWAVQEATGRVKAEIVGGWAHHADRARAAIAKATGVKP